MIYVFFCVFVFLKEHPRQGKIPLCGRLYRACAAHYAKGSEWKSWYKITSRISCLYVSQHGGPDSIPDVFLHNLFMRRFVTLIRVNFFSLCERSVSLLCHWEIYSHQIAVFGCLSQYCYSLSKTVFVYINRLFNNTCHIRILIHAYICLAKRPHSKVPPAFRWDHLHKHSCSHGFSIWSIETFLTCWPPA